VPGLDQLRRHPAAEDAADVGEQIHDDHRQQHDLEVDVIGRGEIFGQPEEHQEPHRVSQELRHRKGPGLALGDDRSPAKALDLFGRVMFDPRQFGFRYLPALPRVAVEPEPEEQQDDAEGAAVDKGLAPVEAHPDHEHPDRRRGEDDADRRRAVDPADRVGAFLLREPFARRADDRREMPRLADAEDDARKHEGDDR